MNYKAPDNSLHFIQPEFAHLLPTGSVPITDEEADALRPQPVPPTPLEQIRVLEAQFADAQAKVTRQLALKALLDEAMNYPEADGMTRTQVHEFLLSNAESAYTKLFTLEQRVEELRSQL